MSEINPLEEVRKALLEQHDYNPNKIKPETLLVEDLDCSAEDIRAVAVRLHTVYMTDISPEVFKRWRKVGDAVKFLESLSEDEGIEGTA